MKPCDKGPDSEMTCWKVGGLGELPAWIDPHFGKLHQVILAYSQF